MSTNDFKIENGMLKKYSGVGGAVVIPEGVHTMEIVLFPAVKNLPFKLLHDVVRNDMPKKTKLNMRRFESFEI